MVDPEPETNQARSATDVQNQKVVDRLVFAALREQMITQSHPVNVIQVLLQYC